MKHCFPLSHSFWVLPAALHISAPTGQDTHLHQKVPCPESFLQPLLIASKRGVHGLWPLFLCYKSRQQNCLWFGSFQSADKKFKVLLAGCVVPLQPSQPGARSFPHVLAVPPWIPLAEGLEEGELLHHHFQTPHPSPPHPFTKFCFLLDQAKDWKELFAVSRGSGFQFWHWALQKSFAVSMTNLAVFWLLGCHAWTSGRELRRWDQKEHFVIWEQRFSHPTQSSHAVLADADTWLLEVFSFQDVCL